jgi:Integrase core domain
VVDSEASRHRFRFSARWVKLAAIAAGISPGHSCHRLLLCRHAAAVAVVCAVCGGTRDLPRPRPRSHRELQRCLGGLAGPQFCHRPRRPRSQVQVFDSGPRQQVHQHFRRRVRQRGDAYPAHAGTGTPGANAIAKRWIGTIRRELLDRMLIFNRHHLMAVLAEYGAHFNHHRPPRALNQAAPLRSLPPPGALSQLCLRQRNLLSGLIHKYAQLT